MTKNGFTLIELVIVIILLAILSVSVLPNLSLSSDYAIYTEQDELISLFRNIQQRAMQNTQDGYCQAAYINSNNLGLAAVDSNGVCQNAFATTTQGPTYMTSEYNVVVSPVTTQIEFDDWGRPNNATFYKVTIANQVAVCIESQGYIHECAL